MGVNDATDSDYAQSKLQGEKEILKNFGAPVSKGLVIKSIDQIPSEISKLSDKKYVLKAQIHAGGRGKAGGVKLIEDKEKLLSFDLREKPVALQLGGSTPKLL